MPATAMLGAAAGPGEPLRRIASFLDGFSLGTSRLGAGEEGAVHAALPAGTPIYLTAIPGRLDADLIDAAVRLRTVGIEAVPHLAVRAFESRDALDNLLAALASRADVRRVMVVAGDQERAAGPFASAIEVIESGLLQRHGISEVAVAGYPEGHPRITADALQRTLASKIEAAEQTGLAVHIVTQFAFDPDAIVRWLGRLRDLGIEHPVRVGMAGPTSLPTLLRCAQECGVRASVQGLTRQAGLLKHLVGTKAPDGIIRALAEACADDRLGRVGAHFFSFGGAARSARWAAAAAAGRIVLDRAGGFGVEPR
jgi:methylenetetrahydrofolate reductase (NADPH)